MTKISTHFSAVAISEQFTLNNNLCVKVGETTYVNQELLIKIIPSQDVIVFTEADPLVFNQIETFQRFSRKVGKDIYLCEKRSEFHFVTITMNGLPYCVDFKADDVDTANLRLEK